MKIEDATLDKFWKPGQDLDDFNIEAPSESDTKFHPFIEQLGEFGIKFDGKDLLHLVLHHFGLICDKIDKYFDMPHPNDDIPKGQAEQKARRKEPISVLDRP